ncbi:hypothetical protein ACQ4LE_008624 [Meloidogyne hapla]
MLNINFIDQKIALIILYFTLKLNILKVKERIMVHTKWILVFARAPPLHLKCKYEIGFDICRERENIFYTIEEDGKEYKLPETFTWNNEDIFGCGLVYPPNKKMSEEFPYIFFTQNGKHIGKGILLKDNFEYFHPYIALDVSSLVETNFGNDLKERPFCYEITKHSVLKEFYED